MENPPVVFELQGDKLVDSSPDMHTGVARERRGDVFLRFLYVEGFFVVEYVGNAYFEEDHGVGKIFRM